MSWVPNPMYAFKELQLSYIPPARKGLMVRILNVFMSFLCWETPARKVWIVRTLNVFMSFLLCWETPARKCLHVLPLLEDTSKKGFDGEDLASAKIKTS